jgi:YidC/Oxa1 family membrane protein insertase
MDRNTVIGFVLIGLVLMLWMWMNAPQQPPPPPIHQDSTSVVTPRTESLKRQSTDIKQVVVDTLGKFFKDRGVGTEQRIVVDGELYRAQISTRGGAITSWELKNFKTWFGAPVNLINQDRDRDFNLLFYTSDGKIINTKNIFFEPPPSSTNNINLAEQDSAHLDFVLNINSQSRIVKSYLFSKKTYSFDVVYRFEGMENIISNYEYQVIWENGLKYQERNSVDESNSAMAYAYAGGELTEVDASKFNEPPVKQEISGRVKWVATRNKYFGLAIIARDVESQGAFLQGERERKPDNGAQEIYTVGLKMPFLGKPVETARFTVFLGPLNFDLVKSFDIDLDRIMSLGAAWIIRPIAQYVMMPLFNFVHLIIPNYGIVIIVFSLIIKVVLYPLTKSSMTSMRKMQALQPMMEEIREKHKDDPQKMNEQVMRLYKEYGVNPAGGCLPMILQLPILYALWAVFRSTIDLRQAPFFGWIHDLSIPDVIATLPFPIPIFNITEISGLAFFMGITMFVQQKMSVKDPRQKAMVWIMPIMMTLLFNSFPSGLNLYYFVFNLFSIGQQYWINKQHKDEPLRKIEQKKNGGFLSRISKDLPRLKS